jgi:hypothetical protein
MHSGFLLSLALRGVILRLNRIFDQGQSACKNRAASEMESGEMAEFSGRGASGFGTEQGNSVRCAKKENEREFGLPSLKRNRKGPSVVATEGPGDLTAG